jgi:SAM-dependent methyltransferase
LIGKYQACDMKRLANRLSLWASQVFFTASLTPLFLWPGLAQSRLVRQSIAYLFGSVLAKRYYRVIEFYGQSYGGALAGGLDKAAAMSSVTINRIIDCGTGTGYAARQAALRFPQAMVVGVDMVSEMLEQARQNAKDKGIDILHVYADTLRLPFLDGSVDLVIAQNTTPFLTEFARVCRPGGVVVFVDSAARWSAPLARYNASQTGCFDAIAAEQAGLGFYLAARRQ